MKRRVAHSLSTGVGNDAFKAGDGMSTELEAYGHPKVHSSLVVLQQRSPPAPGLQQAFATSLSRLLTASSVKQASWLGVPLAMADKRLLVTVCRWSY